MAGNLYEQGYYETGTASVTQGQTVVTGQGTAWLQIVRPADDFGKHVGMPVPIASVDSDTQITLAYPWPGPTQTAEPYRISFTPYHVAYRQALQEIGQLLESGNVSALADLVGAAGTFPIFSGTGTMDLADLSDYAGDVVGPASSTDSNVALFDGTGGKLLKDGFSVSAFMQTVLDDADDAAARSTLGLGSAATQATSAFATAAQGTKADNALPKSGGTVTGTLTVYGNFEVNPNGYVLTFNSDASANRSLIETRLNGSLAWTVFQNVGGRLDFVGGPSANDIAVNGNPVFTAANANIAATAVSDKFTTSLATAQQNSNGSGLYWSSQYKATIQGRSGGGSSGDYSFAFWAQQLVGTYSAGIVSLNGHQGRRDWRFNENGDFIAPGAIVGTSKNFLIDHPLDPANKDLLHASIEAPRYDLIYRGVVTLMDGRAMVDIDAASGMTSGTFEALTK
ncbi:MAG: hypothetical protein ACX94A_13965, partial [Algiphilus sp.]